jgi:hypothetical protein
MSQIDLSDSNFQIAEGFVRAIFASPDPKVAALKLIHELIDHPWLDDEMHDALIEAAAGTLNLSVVADED